MMGDTLALNASYMPVDVINWDVAITLWHKGKAEVLETYEDRILHTGWQFKKPKYGVNDNFIQTVWDEKLESWTTAMQMPAVIRLLEFVNPKKHISFFESFTRQNVYDRDGGRCMYCGEPVSRNKFTFDHVIPRSRGGKTNWQNIVCSCLKCNSKKDNRTPKESGMTLIQKPFAPLIADDFNSGVLNRMKGMSRILSNKKFLSYIYWNVEMKED